MPLFQRNRSYGALSALAAATALAATLASLFIVCAVVAVLVPGFRATHNWIALFTGAPLGSAQAWMQGIVSSAVAGFGAGGLFGCVYNLIAAR